MLDIDYMIYTKYVIGFFLQREPREIEPDKFAWFLRISFQVRSLAVYTVEKIGLIVIIKIIPLTYFDINLSHNMVHIIRTI